MATVKTIEKPIEKPWLFKEGNKANPAGRPRMATHMIFPAEMAKHGYFIAEQIAEAFKADDWNKLAKLKEFMPYCFVQLRAKEFDVKPDSPEQSKLNADEKHQAAKEFAGVKVVEPS